MRRIAAAAVAVFVALQVAAQPVKTGIEVLRDSGFELLKGKRVGLVTNPTGVDSRLVSTIDILDSAAQTGLFRLVALYGPEHGVRGNVAAGEKIASGRDPQSGVPLFSLYGATRKPTAQMLEGVDVLVFDIQDIGSRSYTYISTMGRVMEGAAENGVPVVVLDRPNPLGGLRVEGCETIAPGFSSFVSAYPVPYVHGMTVGELAQMLNVSPGDFFRTTLSVPNTLAEQRAIGAFFSSLDELITLHQREGTYGTSDAEGSQSRPRRQIASPCLYSPIPRPAA